MNKLITDAKFLSGAKSTYPSLSKKKLKKKGKTYIQYSIDIEVPIYEEIRKVRIVFDPKRLNFPTIFSDGLKESKHRYNNNALCIWQPEDKEADKWVYKDGLLQLLALIQLHLFREYYWRETGVWMGLEATHKQVP